MHSQRPFLALTFYVCKISAGPTIFVQNYPQPMTVVSGFWNQLHYFIFKDACWNVHIFPIDMGTHPLTQRFSIPIENLTICSLTKSQIFLRIQEMFLFLQALFFYPCYLMPGLEQLIIQSHFKLVSVTPTEGWELTDLELKAWALSSFLTARTFVLYRMMPSSGACCVLKEQKLCSCQHCSKTTQNNLVFEIVNIISSVQQ